MKLRAPHPSKKARIEIIPLIDVIFFLLATFVLVSLSMVRLQGLNMDLPQASPVPPETKSEIVTIIVGANKNIVSWNGDAINWESLETRMRRLKRDNPDPRILINGDEAAYFGQAVQVLDLARELEISKVSIETKMRPSSTPVSGS